jgi:hypothetical protein
VASKVAACLDQDGSDVLDSLDGLFLDGGAHHGARHCVIGAHAGDEHKAFSYDSLRVGA